MKTAGLSSKTKGKLRHAAKAGNFARAQEVQLAAREKQRILRIQAEQSRLAHQKRESKEAEAKAKKPTESSPE